MKYKRTWTTVRDNEKLHVRKGDLFKIRSGIITQPHDWREWFLTKKEYEKCITYDNRISSYCRDQWAIVLNRYRIIKSKYARKYYDYGTIALILTGSKPGTIKKFFISVPWLSYLSFENISLLANYGNNCDLNILSNSMVEPMEIINKNVYYKSFNLTKFIKENNISRYNEESVNIFLEKIYNLARER
jgi:hypothetical protein